MLSAYENGAEIIACLMKADRTAIEISEMVGCHVKTAYSWIEALRKSGLVREVYGERGCRAPRWSWQRSPFEREDFAS